MRPQCMGDGRGLPWALATGQATPMHCGHGVHSNQIINISDVGFRTT